MLNSFAEWNVPPTSPKRVCLLKYPCLPSSSHSPCAPRLFTFEPSCPEAGSVSVPHSGSCSLQVLATSPLNALGERTEFQWHSHFSGRPGKAIKLAGSRWCKSSESQSDTDKLPSETRSGVTETTGCHCFSEPPKIHFLSSLAWHIPVLLQGQKEFCCWNNSLILRTWPGGTMENWWRKTRREQPKRVPTSVLCNQLCYIKKAGFFQNVIQHTPFQMNKSTVLDGRLCAVLKHLV